jgi:hypothetical protein
MCQLRSQCSTWCGDTLQCQTADAATSCLHAHHITIADKDGGAAAQATVLAASAYSAMRQPLSALDAVAGATAAAVNGRLGAGTPTDSESALQQRFSSAFTAALMQGEGCR